LNAFAERWVRSIKPSVSKLILFVEASLRRALTHLIEHYHLERPHQGKGNQMLFPASVRHHHGILLVSYVTGASADS
jgi:hypothetical protein